MSHNIPCNPELYLSQPTSFCSSRTYCSSLKECNIVSSKHLPTSNLHAFLMLLLFHKEVAIEQNIYLFVTSLQPLQKRVKECLKIFYILQDMTLSQKKDNYITVFAEQCSINLYIFVLMSTITSKPWAIYFLMEMWASNNPHKGNLQLGKPLFSQR